jgi:riboflavin synthase
MFTGIVEALGEVRKIEKRGEGVRFDLDAGPVAEGVKLGDSIAVNGACLTVAEIGEGVLAFDVVRETLECTSLGDLEVGAVVNLERAMAASSRFDGHIVQGHVDGTGRVSGLERAGSDVRFFVECGQPFADQLVDKGSVTIEGVSLTVVEVGKTDFHVVLIPHTLAETTLGQCEIGQRINLEADVIGKYVKRYLARMLDGATNDE